MVCEWKKLQSVNIRQTYKQQRGCLMHFVRLANTLLIVEDVHACNTHTHTHPFNGLFSGTDQASRYQKGKNNLDFTEARDSPQLSFLQAECPSCRPTNSVKALKAKRSCL